jgi:hypothetical protein
MCRYRLFLKTIEINNVTITGDSALSDQIKSDLTTGDPWRSAGISLHARNTENRATGKIEEVGTGQIEIIDA